MNEDKKQNRATKKRVEDLKEEMKANNTGRYSSAISRNTVLIDLDKSIKPAWDLLLLIYACKKVAETNDLALREQLHIWRPFDV